MKKWKLSLLVAAAVTVVGWLCLSTAYTHTVSREVTRIRREGRSDVVYLRTRLRELESELTSLLMEQREPDSETVDGIPETETEASANTEPETEAVTVPTHQSPETRPSEETTPETHAPAAMFLLTEHNGVIGIFDASGELVRTLNVFVMTLPEAERQVLRVGIPAYSHEEMLRLASQYE